MLKRAHFELIEDVTRETLKRWGLTQEYGSLIIMGQKRGKGAKEIFRCNLGNGVTTFEDDECKRLYSHTSERAVETAIDELLAYPRQKLSCDHPRPDDFGQLSSNLYYVGKPRAYAMVINTTYGRFIASVATDHIDLSIQILQGITVAIGWLADSDKILSESVNQCVSLCQKDSAASKTNEYLHSITTKPDSVQLFYE